MPCHTPHTAPAELGFADSAPEFHGLAMPRELRGEISDAFVPSRRLSGDRFVRVYAPGSALRGTEPLPVVIVNDGHKAFEPARSTASGVAPWSQNGTLQLHRIMDGLTCTGEIRPAIVVAVSVHAASRGNEFVPHPTELEGRPFGGRGEEYLDLIEHDVLPYIPAIVQGVAVSQSPADRLIVGTSLGGFAALYGALTRPHVFGGAVALSPSAWVDDGFLRRLVVEKGVSGGVFALDIGADEAPYNQSHCVELFKALEGAVSNGGGRVSAEVVVGRHHEDSWRGRIPSLLRFVIGERSS